MHLPTAQQAGERLAAGLASAYSLRAVGAGLASNDAELGRLLGFEGFTPVDGQEVKTGRPVPNTLRALAGGPPWYLIVGFPFGAEHPETAWQHAFAAYMCEPGLVQLVAPQLYDYFRRLFGREFRGKDSYAAIRD